MTDEELNIAVAKIVGWKVDCTEPHKNWVVTDPNGTEIVMGAGYDEEGAWTVLYRTKLPRWTTNLNKAWPLLKGLPLALTFLSRMLEADQSAKDVAYRICTMLVEFNAKKMIPLPEEYPYPEEPS